MIYQFLYEHLGDKISFFNVFRYITVRSAGAAVTAMVLSLIIGPYMIRRLYRLKVGQPIRKDECPPLHQLHKSKQGTPTMGGLLIIVSVCISVVLWSKLNNPYIWIAMFAFVGLGILGFADDYLKVKHKNTKGVNARGKLIVQALIAVIVAVAMLRVETSFPLYVPFIKMPVVANMGYLFIIYAVVVISGTSNAVNLTDGLDGLAIGSTIICAMAYTILTYIAGNVKISDYLFIFHSEHAAELTIFCAALVGAGLGFLWFNAHPAMVFMGDTGSLAIGGVIGCVALLIRKEVLLIIIGGIFVVEALSSLLQIHFFRWSKGKRLFKMAPIHHHFEMSGWPETRVTVRFWIIGLICALIGLASIKLQ